VEVTDSNGCKTTSSPVTFSITGIEEQGEELIRVYPNPASRSSFRLSVANAYVGSQLDMHDAGGQMVFHSLIQNAQSEIPFNVATGVYYLRISSPTATIIRKLIKF
jgi:hypothetical protein